MTADVTRQVETEFTLADKVTAPLRNMHAAATRITGAFDKASLTVGKFGSLASVALGGFALGSTIAGTQRYLQTVRDITAATGFAAENVDATLELFDRANISAGEGAQIIQKLAVSMARYKMEINKTGKAQSDASLIIKRLGINLNQGPVKAMETLAKQARQGKLTMSDLIIGFQVSETSAIRLQGLLKRGPAEVGRIMNELKDQGLAINATNLAAFSRYEEATIRIRSAWNRIAIVVGTKVLPVITNLLEKVMGRMEGWTAVADEWGDKIAGWLDKHLSKVIMIGKVMAANAALQATLGVGVGQVAAGGMRMAGRFMGLGGGGGVAAAAVGAAAGGGAPDIAGALKGAMSKCCGPMGRMAEDVKRYMDPATLTSSVKSGVATWTPPVAKVKPPAAPTGFFGKLTGFFRGFFGRIGRFFTRIPLLNKLPALFGKMLPVVGKLAATIARFTIVGAIITGIVATVIYAYQMIQGNVMGVRDLLVQWWDQIKARVLVIVDILSPLFTTIKQLFGTTGPVGKFFGTILIGAINALGMAVDGIMLLIQTMILMVSKAVAAPSRMLSPLELFTEAAFEAQARTAAKYKQITMERDELPLAAIPSRRRAPDTRPPPTVNDFRGSKFDIKQMFAEGFDPDRIAVAFTNDLAALGEKRLQSSLAPLGAVR